MVDTISHSLDHILMVQLDVLVLDENSFFLVVVAEAVEVEVVVVVVLLVDHIHIL